MPEKIIDGHLDLAWNALSYDRDQIRDINQIRYQEAAVSDSRGGGATVSLPEMRRGGVAVCGASLLARAKPGAPTNPRDRTDIDYATQDAAYAVAQGQLAYYRLLEQRGQVRIIRDTATLESVWAGATAPDDTPGGAPVAEAPIGLILSMEGADPIVHPDQLQHWWDCGLRAVSLAHYGPSAYACGTPSDSSQNGGLTRQGQELLKQMAPLGVMLDLTHSSDASFAEAIDSYNGPVFASHSNCRALVPGLRQLSDDQIRRIADRGGVIGSVLEASMLCPRWGSPETPRSAVGLKDVSNHIDHVCQLVGCIDHAAVGSDLDGGFGTQRCPHDLDTISDLQCLGAILRSRGYSPQDVGAVLHGNWLRFFRESLSG